MKPFNLVKRLPQILFFGHLLLMPAGCQRSDGPPLDEDRIKSFKALKPELVNPSAEYRTVPFAVWNGKVTREKICAQYDILEYGLMEPFKIYQAEYIKQLPLEWKSM